MRPDGERTRMTTTAYLLSTVITGVVLLGVALYVARAFAWQRLARRVPSVAGGATAGAPELPGATATPSPTPIAVGSIAVFAVAAGVGAAVVPASPVLGALVGLFGGLLALYVTWGTYHICRARGMTYAQAVGFGVWILAMVFLLGVVARLLLGG